MAGVDLRFLEQAYSQPEAEINSLFADAITLRVRISPENARRINLAELDKYLKTLENDDETPPRVVLLDFAGELGAAVIPGTMLPRQALNSALVLVSSYMKEGHNREYMRQKLMAKFYGNEAMIAGFVEQLVSSPRACVAVIETCDNWGFQFWSFLALTLKNDIEGRKNQKPLDLAILRASMYIVQLAAYYEQKTLAAKAVQEALLETQNCFRNPPYLFSMDAILKFTGTDGNLLLGRYSKKELSNWLAAQTRSEGSELPPLVIFKNLEGVQCYIRKDKIVPFCLGKIKDLHESIAAQILVEWKDQLLQFKKPPALEDKAACERLVGRTLMAQNPMLSFMLRNPLFLVAYDEGVQDKKAGYAKLALLNNKGTLIPMSELFDIRRSEMARQVRLELPFWYTIPMLFSICGFFWRLIKGKTAGNAAAGSGGKGSARPRTPAEQVIFNLLPQGKSLNDYLRELEHRWRPIGSPVESDNTVSDVQSLIRDSLRTAMRGPAGRNMSAESIASLAERLMGNNTLRMLEDTNALRTYIQLYIAREMKRAGRS